MDLHLRIRDASGLVVVDVNRISVTTPGGTVVPTPTGDGGWTAALPQPFVAPTHLRLEIDSGRFYPYVVTFVITRTSDGQLSIVCTGPSYGRLTLTPGVVDVAAVLSRLKRVDAPPDPSIIPQPFGPNWYHKQTGDEGSFFKGNEHPQIKLKEPLLGPSTAEGIARLTYDLQTPVRPSGRIYVFELKTATAPRLLFVWHPVQMHFPSARPGGSAGPISYHFYYHPTAKDPTAYPYGRNQAGVQPHVLVGYRHLMFETSATVQLYYARRRVVWVVPVASPAHQFGEAATTVGVRSILNEINLALHSANAAYEHYERQPVGRVAMSGFSAGALQLVAALSDRSSPLGQSFLQNNVKEIYCWDGATDPPNQVPAPFGAVVKNWWRDADQKVRVYTQDAEYAKHLAFLQKHAAPTVKGAGGSYVLNWAKDGKDFGTMVYLPDPFFRSAYLPHEDPVRVYQGKDRHPTDKGFPSYRDTHHWFFTVAMYHALSRSGFPTYVAMDSSTLTP